MIAETRRMIAGAQPFELDGVMRAEDRDVVELCELRELPVVRSDSLVVNCGIGNSKP